MHGRNGALRIIWAVAWCLFVGPAFATPPDEAGHEPFVWTVTVGTRQHCLVGSVHALPLNRTRLPAAIQQCLDTAQALAVEAIGQLRISEADYVRRLGAIAEAQPGGLLSRLDVRTAEQLTDAVSELGLALDQFRYFKPWFAAQTLSSFRSVASQLAPHLGVDRQLYRQALNRRLPVRALAADGTHDAIFTQMPEATSVQYLKMVLDRRIIGGEQLVQAWVDGREGVVRTYVDQLLRNYPLWYERVLAQRNRDWVQPIEQMLSSPQTHLIVAGAAHFFGPDSVPELLQQRGWVLKRVPR